MYFFRHLLGVLLFALTPVVAISQDYPAYSEIYVNDFADLLPTESEDRIRQMLIELREKRGIEFTVVTISRLSDYGHNGPIEPFATGLFNAWGVGDATRNDGLMLLVSRYDRRLRIEVGSGYGSTKNIVMKNIIDDVIVPWFRSDNYPEGIERGVREVIYDVTGSWPGEYDATALGKAVGAVKRWFTDLSGWFYVVLIPLLAFPVRAYRRWRRNRPRKCPIHGIDMTRLDETWDDNHLQKGQIKEEDLKSVDYDVWQCPTCDHVTVEAYRAWFSQYGACRSCGYRTVEGTTTILEYATTSRSGRKRIDYHCHNCQDSYSVTKTIPRKSERRSSSSSGGSFGGGSSRGGGASGSW